MRKPLSLILAVLLAPHSSFSADALRIRILGPVPLIQAQASPAFTSMVIDAANEKAGWVFQSSDAAVVTHLMFRYTLRTGTPVQHRISIQGIGTTGLPDGTPVATAAFTPPADTSWDATMQVVALSHDGAGNVATTYTLTRGSFYSIVIEACPNATAPCSGAVSGSGTDNSSFTVSSNHIGAGRPLFPYAVTAPGGTMARVTTTDPVYGYRSASLTYGTPILAYTVQAAISSGDEWGFSFTIPSTWFTSFQVVGVRAIWTPGAAAKSTKMVLYSGTTVQQSVTLDSDAVVINSSSRGGEFYFADTNLVTLNTGSLYRIGFSPQSATQNLQLTTIDLVAAGDRTAFPGQTIMALSSRTGCGAPCDGTSTAWAADTTTSLPMVELILDVITAPAAGGQKAYSFVQ